MSKHTPGPWEIEEYLDFGDEYWYGGNQGFTIHAGPAVLGSTNKGDIPKAQANARLIAAAPELLAALKAAKKYTELLIFQVALNAQIDEAIAKAEGRQ